MDHNHSHTVELIINACTFAACKHRNQKRKNKEQTPYINHPLNVCNLLVNVGKITDPVTLAAAVLHDVVEDTGTSIDEIKNNFGEKVASIVSEVTDNKSLTKVERKKLQVKNGPNKSYEAKLIKEADKLDNLTGLLEETPNGWSPEIRYGYFVWSYHVIKGMRGTNEYLEQQLDKVFAQVIKPDDDLEAQLQAYYQLL